MQNRLALEPLVFEWTAFAPRGAVSVGFGSFHPIGKYKTAPMLLATIGMCVSTLVGTLAGFSPLILAVMAALWGFLCGLLIALGAGASWFGLQSVIALLVVGAYPVSVGRATARVLDPRRGSAANRLHPGAAVY
jgi:hypothetical protein